MEVSFPSSALILIHKFPISWRGGPDAALSVWIVEQQEVTGDTLALQSFWCLSHPGIPSDVWASPPAAMRAGDC